MALASVRDESLCGDLFVYVTVVDESFFYDFYRHLRYRTLSRGNMPEEYSGTNHWHECQPPLVLSATKSADKAKWYCDVFGNYVNEPKPKRKG